LASVQSAVTTETLAGKTNSKSDNSNHFTTHTNVHTSLLDYAPKKTQNQHN